MLGKVGLWIVQQVTTILLAPIIWVMGSISPQAEAATTAWVTLITGAAPDTAGLWIGFGPLAAAANQWFPVLELLTIVTLVLIVDVCVWITRAVMKLLELVPGM